MQKTRRSVLKEKGLGPPYNGKRWPSKRRHRGVQGSNPLKSPILGASACNTSSGKSFVVGHETDAQGHHPPRRRHFHGSVHSSARSPRVTSDQVDADLKAFLLATPDLRKLTSMIPVATVDVGMKKRHEHRGTQRDNDTRKPVTAMQCMVSLVEILAKSASEPMALQTVLRRISDTRRVDSSSPVLTVTVIENLIALVTATESALRAKFLVDHLNRTVNPDHTNAYGKSLLRRLAAFCFSSWVEQTKNPPAKENWSRRNDLLVVYMDFIQSHWGRALHTVHQCDYIGSLSDRAEFAEYVERMSLVNEKSVRIISQYVSFASMADALSRKRMDGDLFWKRLATSGVLKHLMDTQNLCVPLPSRTSATVSSALTTRDKRAWTL